MVRVIVERQLKSGEDIGRLLLDLHMIAVLQKGHISNETWIDVNNNHAVAVFSTWQRLEDWKAWESSKERAKIISRIDPLLAEKAQIKIYEIMSPLDCQYYVDPESWIQEHEHPHFEG
jgi:heme-degrading monooxygenase HmoA